MGFFPDSGFIERLFRYDVSVIQRSQSLNVVSIGNTDRLLPSQQNLFISLISLSLHRNKKYADFKADIVWTRFSFSRALKSAVSLSLICRSYLLFFVLLFNCCFLFLISWFIRQAFQMIRTTRSFRQRVVYLIIINVLSARQSTSVSTWGDVLM